MFFSNLKKLPDKTTNELHFKLDFFDSALYAFLKKILYLFQLITSKSQDTLPKVGLLSFFK